jgi:hypothetical protein
LNEVDNTIFRDSQLRGKWALISVDSGSCDESCRKKAHYMRQVRTIQNTEKERIERYVMIDDGAKPSADITKEFDGMWLINGKDSDLLKELPQKSRSVIIFMSWILLEPYDALPKIRPCADGKGYQGCKRYPSLNMRWNRPKALTAGVAGRCSLDALAK